jgi:hypothetical protein
MNKLQLAFMAGQASLLLAHNTSTMRNRGTTTGKPGKPSPKGKGKRAAAAKRRRAGR